MRLEQRPPEGTHRHAGKARSDTQEARGILRGRAEGWALCVGAGTSSPAFPLWNDLARDLLGDQLTDTSVDRLTGVLSPNAVIQTFQNERDMDPQTLAEDLTRRIYNPIRSRVGEPMWPTVARALAAQGPGDLAPSVWNSFIDVVSGNFPGMSGDALASIVVESLADTPPSAIISFNAEPLLYALINARARVEVGRRSRIFDKHLRLVSPGRVGRIPYYFCHGLLPVDGRVDRRVHARSPEHLIFSETSYLQLSNMSYSWQAAAFLGVCSTSSTVFAGMSMSDPNVRTWLAWMHARPTDELDLLGSDATTSTAHYWLHRRSGSIAEDRWVESSVAHLGVRLIWIDEWEELGPTVKSMLALPGQPT